MEKSTVNVLKALFIILGSLMVATLIYTISIDGLPFRKDLIFPWMNATLVDFYINIFVLSVWVVYKESSWLAAVLWIILLICLGSITTCLYITIQLFKLSDEESAHDPMYHVLLRQEDKKMDARGSALKLISAEIIFGALGCIMLATLLYTLFTYGSPFKKELLIPWLVATLIDFYINVAALSVWVAYKEQSWITTVIWIVLLICFGSIVTCGYLVWQFLLLSPHNPLYIVLLNNHHRYWRGCQDWSQDMVVGLQIREILETFPVMSIGNNSINSTGTTINSSRNDVQPIIQEMGNVTKPRELGFRRDVEENSLMKEEIPLKLQNIEASLEHAKLVENAEECEVVVWEKVQESCDCTTTKGRDAHVGENFFKEPSKIVNSMSNINKLSLYILPKFNPYEKVNIREYLACV